MENRALFVTWSRQVCKYNDKINMIFNKRYSPGIIAQLKTLCTKSIEMQIQIVKIQ